ncbi:MAG: preprotein translocase subunit SecE [Clostridia bacterium]|nr:preprotein translocase subunit SecE [Clostridia bacterium]MDD3232388.1 preprotein translocase subunit SecE [Clostridia bacterium]MDD3862347.1 preprotein translocase subunit SecE [Clostridia bacterium]
MPSKKNKKILRQKAKGEKKAISKETLKTEAVKNAKETKKIAENEIAETKTVGIVSTENADVLEISQEEINQNEIPSEGKAEQKTKESSAKAIVAKSEKDETTKQTKAKKVKKPSKVKKKTKEVFSELKKVIWPTFPKVVKKTGTVIVVVLAFAVVLLGIDTLLELAHSWFFSKLN